MNPPSSTGSIEGGGYAKKGTPIGTIGELISQKSAGGTSYVGRGGFRHKPITPKISNDFQQVISTGTYSKKAVNAIPLTSDAYLNIEIDKAVREAVACLDMQYTFRESDQAKSFLSGNNTLRRMLSTIHSKIRREFPSEKIILEVFSDSPHSSEKDIVISVSTSLPVDEAIERLDKVEDVRWNKDSKDPYVDICVKLEYQ
jgi:hypothetical protein